MKSRGDKRAFAVGAALSVVIHGAAVWLIEAYHVSFPTPDAVFALGPTEVVIYDEPLPDPPPAVELPSPGTPIPRPLPPASSSEALREPPILRPPELIPHDVPPRLINGAEIMAVLEQGYPEGLPEEAGSSRVLLWLFVDESGTVTRIRLQISSGYDELDGLATAVAPDMAYAPALHGGDPVGVWVAQRIRFEPPEEPIC